MTNNIILIYSIFVVLLLLIIVHLAYKIKENKRDINKDKRLALHYKNIVSMIEYQFRKYTEGQNIYTTMKEISDIFYSIDNDK